MLLLYLIRNLLDLLQPIYDILHHSPMDNKAMVTPLRPFCFFDLWKKLQLLFHYWVLSVLRFIYILVFYIFYKQRFILYSPKKISPLKWISDSHFFPLHNGVTFPGVCCTVWGSAHRPHTVLWDCSQHISAIKVNDADLWASDCPCRWQSFEKVVTVWTDELQYLPTITFINLFLFHLI